jgi:putative FmdB family regulatory protein
MPIYEYECQECDACFERLIFAGEDGPVECPKCGTRKVRKLISCASFIGEGIGGACTSRSVGGFS